MNEYPKYRLNVPLSLDIKIHHIIALKSKTINEKLEEKFGEKYESLNLEVTQLNEAYPPSCFSDEGEFINPDITEFWEKERFQYKIILNHPKLGQSFIVF
jgi:hypothetical protein